MTTLETGNMLYSHAMDQTASSRAKISPKRKGNHTKGKSRKAFTGTTRRNTFLGIDGGLGSGRVESQKLTQFSMPDSVVMEAESDSKETNHTHNALGNHRRTRKDSSEHKNSSYLNNRVVRDDADVLQLINKEANPGTSRMRYLPHSLGGQSTSSLGEGALDLSHHEDHPLNDERLSNSVATAPGAVVLQTKPPPPPGPPPPSAQRRKGNSNLTQNKANLQHYFNEAFVLEADEKSRDDSEPSLHQLAKPSSDAERIAELEQENSEIRGELAQLKQAFKDLEKSNTHLRRERDKAVLNGRRAALLAGTKFSIGAQSGPRGNGQFRAHNSFSDVKHKTKALSAGDRRGLELQLQNARKELSKVKKAAENSLKVLRASQTEMEGKVADMELNANRASLRVKELETKLKESENNVHTKVSNAIQSAKKQSEEDILRLQTRINQLEKQLARQRRRHKSPIGKQSIMTPATTVSPVEMSKGDPASTVSTQDDSNVKWFQGVKRWDSQLINSIAPNQVQESPAPTPSQRSTHKHLAHPRRAPPKIPKILG